MRSKLVILGATVILGLSTPSWADETRTAGMGPAGTETSPPQRGLGTPGVDEQGRSGRIHVVKSGDTLWDVSDAYLGTPWVWPAIWSENTDIENPHLIRPGDRLWITEGEIRRISAEEADRMMAGASVPAALADGLETGPPGRFRVADIETVGFVSSSQIQGLATIVDSTVERVWLGDHDSVILGLGEGEVSVGQRLEIFRQGPAVKDPQTRLPIGWETKVLGWAEVVEVHEETAVAMIRMSRGEIRRGDHVLPRPSVNSEIVVGTRPDVEGAVVHTPNDRFDMGSLDVVYLNRGAGQGLEVGSPLEVYRPIGTEFDEVRGDYRKLPDHVIGKLLVVATTPGTATAVVTHSTTEINAGDSFRGADSIGW
jgi:hypothetical protein